MSMVRSQKTTSGVLGITVGNTPYKISDRTEYHLLL